MPTSPAVSSASSSTPPAGPIPAARASGRRWRWPRRSPARCRSPWPAGSPPGTSRARCATSRRPAWTSPRAWSCHASPGSGRARTRTSWPCSPSAPGRRATTAPTWPSGPTPVHAGLLEADGARPLGDGARLRRPVRPGDAHGGPRAAGARLRRPPAGPGLLVRAARAAGPVRRSPDRALPCRPAGRGRTDRGGAARSRRSSGGRRRPAAPAIPGLRLYLKREDLAHTGRAQDQQRARPVAADAPAREDPGHRRDRRRPARRRDGHGLRAPRPAVRRLHGRRGHRAPGPERAADARARRRGPLGHLGDGHAQGRGQRGDARLGHERRRPRTTSWARRWGRTRTRRSSATCSAGSATRPRPSSRPSRGGCPMLAIACVGGGSNAIGLLARFIGEPSVRLAVVEAAGDGIETGRHAAAILGGTPGILHGSRSLMLQDRDGQVIEAHSASAGLDYPGIGPQLAALAEGGRIEVASATDREAVAAMKTTTRTEGILPALETAHAIAAMPEAARRHGRLGRPVAGRDPGPRRVLRSRRQGPRGARALRRRRAVGRRGMTTADAPGDRHERHRRRPADRRRVRPRARPTAASRSSRTSSRATRTPRPACGSRSPRPTPVPTCSRSDCPTRTRSPTAPRSSARRAWRSGRARPSRTRSGSSSGSAPPARTCRSSRWATRTRSSAAATGRRSRGGSPGPARPA